VQSNGAIVAAGFTAGQNCVRSEQASDFALARYTADGQLDMTFGTGGPVITSFNGDSASINALAIQSDGKIVALGRDKPASSGPQNPGFTLAPLSQPVATQWLFQPPGPKLVGPLGRVLRKR
jgi:uncharacterized delta-60 repeat protein